MVHLFDGAAPVLPRELVVLRLSDDPPFSEPPLSLSRTQRSEGVASRLPYRSEFEQFVGGATVGPRLRVLGRAGGVEKAAGVLCRASHALHLV